MEVKEEGGGAVQTTKRYEEEEDDDDDAPAAAGRGRNDEDDDDGEAADDESRERAGAATETKADAESEAESEAQAESEAAELQAVEPDPVPDKPRTVLFETDDDPAVVGHVKCSFVKGTDAGDALDTTLAKGETTHVYLDSALLASGVYSEAAVRLMQDNPRQTPLRHAILCVLRTLRPLSLTNPAAST